MLSKLARPVSTRLVAITAAALATAIAPRPSSADTGSKPASGAATLSSAATVRFRIPADPATLDWNLARSSAETYVLTNVMEGLTGESPDLVPRPALAEKWDVSADGKTYVFHLKAGVKWSDGKPLVAQQFVDGWLRLMDPRTHSGYASYLDAVQGAEAFRKSGKAQDRAQVGVRALDPARLQVTLRAPLAYFPHLTTFWATFPVRTDLIRKYGSLWSQPGKLATLGPYRLESWVRGKSITLTASPTYFGVAPQVKRAEIVVMGEDQSARQAFARGELDFLLDATTSDLLQAQSGKLPAGTRVEQFPYLVTYYLGFQPSVKPLSDAGIRKALASAIDRAQIPATLQGGQVAATGLIPPGMEGFGGDAGFAASVPEARKALGRAGYPEGESFPRLTLWLERFDGAEQLGKSMQQSWRSNLGIEVAVQVADPSEFQKVRDPGKAGLLVGHWGADFPDASNFFSVFAASSGTNPVGFRNSEYDSLVDRAQGTSDRAARLSLYAQAERILIGRETAVLPLFHRRNIALVGPRLASFRVSPLNYLFLTDLSLR